MGQPVASVLSKGAMILEAKTTVDQPARMHIPNAMCRRFDPSVSAYRRTFPEHQNLGKPITSHICLAMGLDKQNNKKIKSPNGCLDIYS